MARPFKRGLAYFPLDTDLLGNRKMLRLLDKYGCEGTMVYLAALCEIYASEGYYVRFDQNLCFDIGFTLRLNENLVYEILTFCVSIQLFDKRLADEYKVLSSIAIQKRYLEINKRYGRKHIDAYFVLDQNLESLVKKEAVMPAETPTKGKGKGKEKEKEKENNLNVNNEKQKSYGTESERASSTDEDAKRNAQLRCMLENATASK